MTLDNQALQKLVDLYRQSATISQAIAGVYAEALLGKQSSVQVPACVAAPVAVAAVQPVPLPDPAPVVSVSVKADPMDEPGKPETQRVAVAGIDMTKFGMGKGSSCIAWDVLIAHPPFQMFMSESGFPNPDGKDTTDLAVDFIMAQSKTKAELQFYAEYAKWFQAKGYWPGETPLGQPITTKPEG